jgi:DNA repair exonuclease SbcCD ATPase subunit
MARSLSGEELVALPKELERREDEIKELRKSLTKQEVDQLVKLKAIEEDIKSKCEALDKKEAELSAKIKKWEKANKLTDSAESFSQFYECINKMYIIWTYAGGDDQTLFEAVKKIIEARRSMTELNK